MRIKKINAEAISFDNGNIITFDHYQDCCEWNYADFTYLKDEPGIYNIDFPENLIFESVPNAGFRFGRKRMMFFVPCYSEQNGYYSDDIDIYYCGEKVLNFSAEFIGD